MYPQDISNPNQNTDQANSGIGMPGVQHFSAPPPPPSPPTPPVEAQPVQSHIFHVPVANNDAPPENSNVGLSSSESNKSDDNKPVPVVKVLSVRGVEYGMMTLTLWLVAGALAGCLLSLINKGASFQVLAIPISLLLVCLPVFTFFFIRLKRAELGNPELRFEASKRRFSQITQFLAFTICLVNVVVFVYLIFASFGGNSPVWGKAIGDIAVILFIAGGILAYYWIDEHRAVNK